MKLNENHITGLVRNPNIKRELITTQQNYAKSRMGNLNDINQKVDDVFTSILESKVKSYLIRKTAMEVIDKIKINGSFDSKVFLRIPVQKAEIVLNENQLYRYWFDGNLLRGILIQKVSTTFGPEIRYDSFSICPETGGKSENIYSDTKVKDIAERLFRILIFLYFSEITQVILKPNGKTGTQSTEKYKNDLNQTFIIVDTTWNRISIRTDGFPVSGHFRLQPCGKNNEDRILIFIEEYRKNGYVRGAKKECLEPVETYN